MPNLLARTQLLSICFGLLVLQVLSPTAADPPVTGLPPSAQGPRLPPTSNWPGPPQGGRVVEICPNGCPYPDLARACAAVTSTAEAPVVFLVGPGRYASNTPISCSGQDHAVFRGSGAGASVLENTEQGGFFDYGTLQPGTSTNYVVEQFTIIGHRPIHMDMQLSGGGDIVIRDNEFRTHGLNLDEDCIFIKDPAPGTRLHLEHNRCEFKADGFTLKSDHGRDLQIYAKANHFTSAFEPSLYGAWHFESAPCVFVSQGESFDLGGARMPGGVIVSAYDFQNWSGAGCAAPAQYTIIGPSARIVNTDVTGTGGGAKFMNIGSDVDNIAQITVIGAHADISTTDLTRGYAYGIYNNSAVTDVDVIGGRFRTSGGGGASVDFDGHAVGSTIRLYGVDYQTRLSAEAGGVNVAAGDLRTILASQGAGLGPTTITTPTVGDGLLLFNARDTLHEQSPSLAFRTSPGGTGSKTWRMQASAGDRFTLTNPEGSVVLDWRTGGGAVDVRTGINMTSRTGEITLRDGAASDSTRVRFNGAADAALQWIESVRRLEITGPGVVRLPTSASKPASCAAGDLRVMTDGTFCFCTGPGSPGTWSGLGSGDCNQ